jgi:RNA recognition motif-containing protein
MTTVFVRGFDFGTDEAQVRKHCAQAGQVKLVEMQGKGAAVVTYGSAASAQKAANTLDKSTIAGNTRFLDVKINDEEKATKHVTGGGRVFVRGFDFGTTDEQFESHMSQAGTIEKVMWCTKGSATVIYSSAEEAQKAVDSLNNTTLEGNTRYIDVLLKDADDDRPPAKKQKTSGKGFGKGSSGNGSGKGNNNDMMQMMKQMMQMMGAGNGGKRQRGW